VTSIRLRFVKAYVDRHGRARHYLRRPGHKLVPLPGLPGSPEFMAAYASALEAAPNATTEVGASRTRAGSIGAMIAGYMGTADFHNLAPASQAQYQRILEGLRREYGDLPIASLGIEWAFASNWSAKVEYNYLGLDDRTFTVPAGSPFLAGDTFTQSNRNIQMLKVGANYRFNWSGYR